MSAAAAAKGKKQKKGSSNRFIYWLLIPGGLVLFLVSGYLLLNPDELGVPWWLVILVLASIFGGILVYVYVSNMEYGGTRLE